MSELLGHEPIVYSEWSEGDVCARYIGELGMSLDAIPFDYFQGKSVVYGQYASVMEVDDGIYEAVRDPLGIGKLFYTETPTGQMLFSNQFAQLLRHESPIFSVPAGEHVRLGRGIREQVRSLKPEIDEDFLSAQSLARPGADDVLRERFEQRLQQVFKPLKDLEQKGWTIFVALSGGLDSSIIASNAARYLSAPIACTLDLGKSEDSEKSIMIAEHLGIRHRVFSTSKEQILELLQSAPLACQDFRDFNVHCAVLNMLVGKNIRQMVQSDESIDPDKVIVLTGDLMNEFTCDYAGEVIDDVEYYKLPRIGKKELQRYLINGLDTSDRELSPFASCGIKCIQPFSVLYDIYLGVHEQILQYDDPKKRLNACMVDPEILKFIPKVKLRAQVGSRENMGILGLCHSLGMNNRLFRKNLLEKAGYPKGQIPIFVGKYDVEKFS